MGGFEIGYLFFFLGTCLSFGATLSMVLSREGLFCVCVDIKNSSECVCLCVCVRVFMSCLLYTAVAAV